MIKIFYFLLLLTLVSSIQHIDVFRLFAYEESGKLIGSKVTNFNLVVEHFSQNVLRKIALIKFSDINKTNLVSTLQKKPSGMLIVLPDTTTNINYENEIWESFYKVVANKTNQIPIYFCQETETVTSLYEELTQNLTSTTDKDEKKEKYKIIVQSQEPKPLPPMQLDDYYGYLEDVVKHRADQQTVLLVCNYDLSLPSAEMQESFRSHDKSLIAFFSVIKQLNSLYSVYSKISYNVLFYLTASSTLDYQGLNSWINKNKYSISVSSIEYVIVLGTLIEEASISVDFYNPSDDTEQQTQILSMIQEKGKTYDITVNGNSSSEKYFPSIVKDILTIKLYDIDEKKQKSFIYSGQENFNFSTKINFLSEIIANIVFNPTETDFYTSKKVEDQNYSSSVEKQLRGVFRSVNYLTKETGTSKYIKSIMEGLLTSINKLSYVQQDRKFFTSKPIQAQLTKYFDPFINLYLFGIVLAWLSVVYSIFQSQFLFKVKKE